MTLLRHFVTISLQKINEDGLNEQDDYGVSFSERQYTHGSCLNANPLISLIPRMTSNFRHLLSSGTVPQLLLILICFSPEIRTTT